MEDTDDADFRLGNRVEDDVLPDGETTIAATKFVAGAAQIGIVCEKLKVRTRLSMNRSAAVSLSRAMYCQMSWTSRRALRLSP